MKSDMERPTEFGGRCAFAVSLGKLEVTGKPRWSVVQNGKKYVFSNPIAKLLWRILPKRSEKAQAKWSTRSDLSSYGTGGAALQVDGEEKREGG